jgi:tRNA(His) 5'-end guanylyltransferase
MTRKPSVNSHVTDERNIVMNDSLGDRMKRYEDVSRGVLVRRTPVIMRLDGKAFHTLLRGAEKPFDKNFMVCMWATAQELCKEVQGCQLAYTQSDEISLLLTDYAQLDTQGWFDYGIQKMVSVGASIATHAFNQVFSKFFLRKQYAYGLFDARAFNVPREDVANYFIWRQKDAVRNSIQAVGQSKFSQKQLHGKSCDAIQEMLYKEHAINWNDFQLSMKRGTCIRRSVVSWDIDHETPSFTHNRSYIERLVYPPEPLIKG